MNGKLFDLIDGTSKRKKQPWYKRSFPFRLFFDDEDEYRFSRAERKHIRKAVNEQLDSSQPWININGIDFPKPGHVFRLKEGTRYEFMPPGSPVFVSEVQIEKGWFGDPEAEMMVNVILLDSAGRVSEERPYLIRMQDLEAISESEMGDLLENRKKPLISNDILFDGEAVELVEDFIYKKESGQGAISYRFLKGLRGVIDNPKFRQGMNVDDINILYQIEKRTRTMASFSVMSDQRIYRLQEDYFSLPLTRQGDRYQVFILDHQENFPFTRSQLKRRSFDKDMFDRVVMSEETRQLILSLIYGKEDDLRQWGIESAFKKGRGKIFLAFGPPGTGKTMTGEAIAEKLERPLYIADSTSFGYDLGTFEKRFRDVIDKTERWNSVTLIDEAEGILLSRDAAYNINPRVEAVLRSLEELKRGILWLTTNRPIDIDFAIDPRIRAKISFPDFTTEHRRKVWEVTLPKDTPISGLLDRHLDELAEIKLNGREIRNVIVNAADRASYEKRNDIPVDYLLAAARTIHENQKILDKAKGGVGFRTNRS